VDQNSLNVIICTYNRASRLAKMLDSLMQADIPPGLRVEIIVVDNNSSDDTPKIVEGFMGRENPAVRYLFEGQQGKSHALNTALKHLTGGIIAFTDDDALVDRHYLSAILEAIGKYPEHGCFGGTVEPVYPEVLPDWLDLHGSMKFLRSAFVDRRDGEIEAPYAELGFSSTPSGCNMFFRREVVEDNGPFRTDLGPQGKRLGFDEDSEYCRRLIDRGHAFYFIPSVIVRHPVYPERLDPQYLLDWRYQCGKSQALGTADAGRFPRLFGVPRYLFREILDHSLGFLAAAGSKTTRFYHRLVLAYSWGQVVGYWRKPV
jgi:glycosyltransferase involved in cell wall biosynthesis